MKSLLLVFLLAGCSGQIHDVTYYLDHPIERAEHLAKCRESPGTMVLDPACVNAEAAEDKAMFSSNRMSRIR